jgi:hypothetical protein
MPLSSALPPYFALVHLFRKIQLKTWDIVASRYCAAAAVPPGAFDYGKVAKVVAYPMPPPSSKRQLSRQEL